MLHQISSMLRIDIVSNPWLPSFCVAEHDLAVALICESICTDVLCIWRLWFSFYYYYSYYNIFSFLFFFGVWLLLGFIPSLPIPTFWEQRLFCCCVFVPVAEWIDLDKLANLSHLHDRVQNVSTVQL